MNQPVRWDQTCSVNIAELDRQHQQLFRTVAELECAVRVGIADTVIINCSNCIFPSQTQ